MKRFAVALLASVMALSSTALGDEIVLDDGFAVENEAIEISADAEMEEEFFESEDGVLAEDEIDEESFEEIAELGFSEDEEELDVASLIEDVEETTDEDALALADDEEIPIDEAHFPDERFRTYYVSWQADKDRNGSLSSEEINAVTVIDVVDQVITNLIGIEYFTALKELHCDENELTSLDVSHNTALETLDCRKNQLTSLNVSGCTALKSLDCVVNQLTSLDVSECTALEYLGCAGNQLTSLNVSKNTALTELWCDDNQLESLDVSGCTALNELWCENNKLTSLDVNHNTALGSLVCDKNQLTSLDVSKCTALYELWCSENQLTNLDVSKCTVLEFLHCESNQLTSLDISKCPYLEKAYYNPTSHTVHEGIEEYEYDGDDTRYYLSCDSSVLINTSSHSHTFGEWTITTPATCVTEGVQTHKCTGCSVTETEVIPATGIHTPVTDPAVAATTTSEGKTEGSHCSVCGTVLVAQQTIPMITPPPAAPVAVPDPITVTKKPSIKKPEATTNKITINWANIKTTSKKTKAVWKKIKKTQIQCATDKAFKNIVKTTTVGKNKTKAAIKGLKKNTTYYVRVRYFDGTGYSKWSSVKKIKTKKK